MPLEVLIDEVSLSKTGCGVDSLSYSRYKVREKFLTAGIRSLRRQGKPLPMQRYRISTFTMSSPIGTLIPETEVQQRVTGCVAACFGNPVTFDQSIRDRTIGSAARNHYGRVKGLNLSAATSMAELPKTMSMINVTAKRLAGAYTALKRGDVNGAFKVLAINNPKHLNYLNRKRGNVGKTGTKLADFAASTWLEIKYGWKPLLQDIDNAADALATSWEQDQSDIRIRSGANRSQGGNVQDSTGTFKVSGSGSRSYAVRTTGWYRVIDPALRKRSALGINHIGSAAWEIVPYSFVVDWLAPVGDWIQSMESSMGLQLLRSCYSVKEVTQSSANVNEWNGEAIGLSHKVTASSFLREVALPPRLTILSSKTDFSKLINADKVVTSLALLRSAFK